MYIKKQYGFFMTLNWSKKPFIFGFLYAGIISAGAYYFTLPLSIPWQPVSVIGIAVAFYLGFKNNSSYDRTWEARKIWGGLVNNSRSFGAAVISFVSGPDQEKIRKELIYRHIAYLTALRHQLRLSRPWEHTENRLNGLYAPTVCENYTQNLEDELRNFLPENEISALEKITNAATQIMKTQSVRLQELKNQDYFEDFRHMELHHFVVSFYEDQGKAERIKNFPFPRQYASTALWLTMVFAGFVPFGIIDILHALTLPSILLGMFLSALIIWVFFLMEKIGDYSENPFEGTYNDVPITSIARGIEIDLREMIHDENIPKPTADVDGFLM